MLLVIEMLLRQIEGWLYPENDDEETKEDRRCAGAYCS